MIKQIRAHLLFPIALCLAACAKIQLVDGRLGPEVSQMPNAETLHTQFEGNIRSLLSCAQRQKRGVVVAHRGGPAPGYPENAMNSFERIAKNAPIIIEVDVLSTADGINVLHHDDQLGRTTTGKGYLHDHTWRELSILNLVDNGGVPTKERMVTLDQFLARFSGHAFLMFDLKAPSSIDDLVSLIEKHGALDSSIFIAYNTEQALSIRALAPTAQLALGVSDLTRLKQINASGLARLPYIVLAGNLESETSLTETLRQNGNPILKGSYFGDDSIDTRLSRGLGAPELQFVSDPGIQLVVSNRPLLVHAAIAKAGLAIDPKRCPTNNH